MKQIDSAYISREAKRRTDPLTLYDQYGSMAYGIILRIIPEAEAAQAVLVDLFCSPQLKACTDTPTHTAGEIIRLARIKALDARSVSHSLPPRIPAHDTNDKLANIVFDLSFCQGYTPEAIAEKLQLSQTNVLKFIYTYFKDLRSS